MSEHFMISNPKPTPNWLRRLGKTLMSISNDYPGHLPFNAYQFIWEMRLVAATSAYEVKCKECYFKCFYCKRILYLLSSIVAKPTNNVVWDLYGPCIEMKCVDDDRAKLALEAIEFDRNARLYCRNCFDKTYKTLKKQKKKSPLEKASEILVDSEFNVDIDYKMGRLETDLKTAMKVLPLPVGNQILEHLLP